MYQSASSFNPSNSNVRLRRIRHHPNGSNNGLSLGDYNNMRFRNDSVSNGIITIEDFFQ